MFDWIRRTKYIEVEPTPLDTSIIQYELESGDYDWTVVRDWNSHSGFLDARYEGIICKRGDSIVTIRFKSDRSKSRCILSYKPALGGDLAKSLEAKIRQVSERAKNASYYEIDGRFFPSFHAYARFGNGIKKSLPENFLRRAPSHKVATHGAKRSYAHFKFLIIRFFFTRSSGSEGFGIELGKDAYGGLVELVKPILKRPLFQVRFEFLSNNVRLSFQFLPHAQNEHLFATAFGEIPDIISRANESVDYMYDLKEGKWSASGDGKFSSLS